MRQATSFMFLMNLPYQSCPFCVPNTSQLSNTMEVYPKKGCIKEGADADLLILDSSLNLEGMIVSNPVNIKYLTNIDPEIQGTLLITRKENIIINF